MATLNDYFRSEAREFLIALERSLQRSPGPDATELHHAVRGLRGTAQMARENRVFDVVSAFEAATRSIADGALTWSDTVAARARDTVSDLRALLERTEDDEQLDERVNRAAARWREADPAASSQPGAAPVVDGDTREFREFAAREAAGIADVLDHAIADLQANPMDRDSLTNILRRQRALLGSARLDGIPVLSDILRAVEDLSRVIVKLDVGVKKEWLDIYRVARDALQTTIAPLLRDELPESSHSVSRLRHMREELLERYGSSTDDAPPPEGPPPHAAALHAPEPALMAGSAEDDAADQDAADMMELGEDSVVNDPASSWLEPIEDAYEPDAGEGMLDLTEASVVSDDDDVLELDDADVSDDDGVLDLLEANVVEDEAMLELGEERIVEDDVMLELEHHNAMDEAAVLELDEDSAVDEAAVLDLGEADIIDGSEASPDASGAVGSEALSAPAALDRALALRDVIERVAAHDPQARRAVEELFALISIARG